MPDREPLLSVALCTRNRAALLQRAIQSVVPQLGADAELLIVDNASTDDTPDAAQTAKAAHPEIRVLVETRPGLSFARNAALREARGRFVIFLDDDAVAEPGWLDAYRKFFCTPPSARVAVAGGFVAPEYETPPPRWLRAGLHTFDLGGAARPINEHRGPWGCNIAYAREPALRVGGFNPRLGRRGTSLGAHEEMDLNLRLEDAGFEVWWLPDARIRHRITADRMRLGWQLRSEFAQSRSRVTVKFQKRRRGERLLYGAGRVLIAPVACAIHLAVALVTSPVQHGRFAVQSLERAARAAGVAVEVLARAVSP